MQILPQTYQTCFQSKLSGTQFFTLELELLVWLEHRFSNKVDLSTLMCLHAPIRIFAPSAQEQLPLPFPTSRQMLVIDPVVE